MSDFSRWTFDRRAAYRSVLLQQGRVLLDADWNEQTQITAHHDEVRTLDLVGSAGGPLGDAAFGLTDAAGKRPAKTAWPDLRVTPGRFYVDGVLAEVVADPAGAGPPLRAQPYLPILPDEEHPERTVFSLEEPKDDGRYAVVLEVREDHVSADEEPRLREPALGGPDTTTRSRTVWQLTLRKVAGDESCAKAQMEPWLRDELPTMTASLVEIPAEKDPCRITTEAGYRRLENQLYRVQIHDVDKSGAATYLWSRENGSVVAGLTAIQKPTEEGAELSLDREGRDEELWIKSGNLVEVTSAHRRLHGLPGFLARCGAPQGQTLPVKWLEKGKAPADLPSLGQAPIVRRWEGEPQLTGGADEKLEGGIQVKFAGKGFEVGDYWLIPARTVRLVYGQSALAGTIDWPQDDKDKPLPQPPAGTLRHRTVVGLLDRATAGSKASWTLHADCRRLTPPLTQLVSLDLLGGDGQEALPGTQLPHPVRVAVRNGGLPVEGASVSFAVSDGGLAKPPANADPASPVQLTVETDAEGQAEVRWLLDADGSPAQSLTARLLDDAGAPVGVQVRAVARLSLASQVGYDPAACPDLAEAGAETVQEAIDVLGRRRSSFPGIHVEGVVTRGDRKDLRNDSVIELERFAEGVQVFFDAPIDPRCAKHPVLTLGAEIPWPVSGDDPAQWKSQAVGTWTVDLNGSFEVEDQSIVWRPRKQVVTTLKHQAKVSAAIGGPLLVRLSVLGNAIVAEEEEELCLNGRTLPRLDGDRIDLTLPSVDDVHGADFEMWFWITPERERGIEVNPQPRIEVAPAKLVFLKAGEQLAASIQNTGDRDLEYEIDVETTSPPGGKAFSTSDGGVLVPGATQLLLVTCDAFDRGMAYAGYMRVESNDPNQPEVDVELATRIGIIGLPGGLFRLKSLREEVAVVVEGPPEEPADPLRLRKELEKRGQPLRLALAPGFEDSFDTIRSQLTAAGIEVERVDGDPAELARRAESGEIVLDGIIGDGALANRLAEARR